MFGLFSRKRKTKNSLSTSRTIFWGNSKAGTAVTEITAMQTAAVYACVRVISESIASLPLHVFRRNENGAKAMPEHYLYNLLHYSPNPEMSSFVFRETLMSHLLIWGNAYAQIIRDGGGRVIGLYPLLPNKMQIYRGDNGKLYYTYWRDNDERRPCDKSGAITFTREEVLHIPGLSFDGLYGYSPIALAKNAVGMAIATEDYGASFFANGANPGGILEHPDTVGNPEDVRSAWETLYKGAHNSNRVAVLEDGLKFKAVSIPPEQAQFLQTRKFQLNEIARIFRVPPHMIGDLDKSSFSNIEQQSLEFVKYCINPWVERWEQSMQMSLITPSEKNTHYIKFNIDGLMRGDYETRMKGYSVGIQNGFLSPNDVRRLEDLNLIESPAGDRYMVNGNMIDIEDVGKQWGKGDNNE
jgi:HK97 family phage portal protein